MSSAFAILACAAPDVPNVLAQHPSAHVLALLSPGNASEHAHEMLVFHDVAKTSSRAQAEGSHPYIDEIATSQQAASRNDDTLIPPSAAQIAHIIATARACHAAGRPVLFHCYAGVSRSMAAALIAACATASDANIPNLTQQLRAQNPFATPNPLMIALADAQLHLNGALIDAVAQLGRGQDAMWGSVVIFCDQ